MLAVTQDKIMNVSCSLFFCITNDGYLHILGFEDADYYPEKNPDHRVRRERVPVSFAFFYSRLFSNISVHCRVKHGNQLF
jgi:hypothetical protein